MAIHRWDEVLFAQSTSNAPIKNTASAEYSEGLYPAFSATGQDVWLRTHRYEGHGIVVSAVGARCGKSFKADGKWNVVANTHALYVNEDIALRDYCWYALNNEEWWIKAGSGQPFVKLKDSLKRKHCFPSIEEQRKIVEELDKVAQLISMRKEQLAKLDQLVKSRFIELFGDPLHPTHSKPLGDVAVLERGRFSPRPRNDPRYYGGDYPFIQTGDIANCGHRLSTYRQTLNEKGIHVSKKFPVGTIVIAIVGATIGATAILEIEVYAPDSVIGISVDTKQYNAVFMETLLQFWQPELLRIAPESARANINLGILQNIPIIDAELQLQEQFAAFVEQTDKSKLAIQQSLDKLELLKKSLMQEYFG